MEGCMSRERHRVTWLHHHAHSTERGCRTLLVLEEEEEAVLILERRVCTHTERERERELDEASGLVAVELSSRVVSFHPDSSQTIPPSPLPPKKGQLKKKNKVK